MELFHYYFVANQIPSAKMAHLISSIHEYKGKQDYYMETQPNILPMMWENTKVQNVIGANQPDGVAIAEVRLNKLIRDHIKPQNYLEEQLVGYFYAQNKVIGQYMEMPFSTETILLLHKELFRFRRDTTGGQWRKTNFVNHGSTLEANRTWVDAKEIPMLMDTMCFHFNHTKEIEFIEPLLLIPMMLADFITVNPFREKNEQVGYLLMTLLLLQEGYAIGKYISLESLLQVRGVHFCLKMQRNETDKPNVIVEYITLIEEFLHIILEAYIDLDDRLKHLKYKRLSKTERIRRIFQERDHQITKSEIHVLCPDISYSTIEHTLTMLAKEGMIQMLGKGRYAAYIIRKVIEP